jgi:hypothetical protein
MCKSIFFAGIILMTASLVFGQQTASNSAFLADISAKKPSNSVIIPDFDRPNVENQLSDCVITAIEEEAFIIVYELSVSPHPTLPDCLFVDTDFPDSLLFQLTSSDGKRIEFGVLINQTINIRDLLAGDYVLELRSKDAKFIQKVAISKK